MFFEIQDIESGQFVGLEKVYKKEDLKKIFIMEVCGYYNTEEPIR